MGAGVVESYALILTLEQIMDHGKLVKRIKNLEARLTGQAERIAKLASLMQEFVKNQKQITNFFTALSEEHLTTQKVLKAHLEHYNATHGYIEEEDDKTPPRMN